MGIEIWFARADDAAEGYRVTRQIMDLGMIHLDLLVSLISLP